MATSLLPEQIEGFEARALNGTLTKKDTSWLLESLGHLTAEIERLRFENKALRRALERLANPNYGVRATGQDARDMATFARATLAAHEGTDFVIEDEEG